MQFNKEHSKVGKRERGASLPSVVLDHVSQLDDKLSLFVLLTALERVFLEREKKRVKSCGRTCEVTREVTYNTVTYNRNVQTEHTTL